MRAGVEDKTDDTSVLADEYSASPTVDSRLAKMVNMLADGTARCSLLPLIVTSAQPAAGGSGSGERCATSDATCDLIASHSSGSRRAQERARPQARRVKH